VRDVRRRGVARDGVELAGIAFRYDMLLSCAYERLTGNCDGRRPWIIQGWNILMGLWRWRVRLLRRRDVVLPKNAAAMTEG